MVTAQVGTKNLTVTQYREDSKSVYIQKDAWESQQFKRRVELLGSIKDWTIHCIEDEGTSWLSSAAKYCQQKQLTHTSVSFQFSEGSMHSCGPIDVYILEVDVKYCPGDKAGKYVRNFILRLIEKQ